MRTKGVHNACLKEIITREVWLFLSLKLTPKNKKRKNRRGHFSATYGEYTDRPTVESKKYLLESVRERIAAYNSFFNVSSVLSVTGQIIDPEGKSVASEQFLRSELVMLEKIVDYLIILDVNSADDNDEL